MDRGHGYGTGAWVYDAQAHDAVPYGVPAQLLSSWWCEARVEQLSERDDLTLHLAHQQQILGCPLRLESA